MNPIDAGSGRPTADRRPWLGLLGWLLITAAAAAFGGQFMPGPWYADLAKPSWTPPGALFGPVWTLLYIMMAVAAWLVWRRRGTAGVGLALSLWVLQLVLNALWSWLFFGRQQIGLALVDIALLWLLIAATILAFRAVHRGAALLLVPYLAWVSFASALNWALWRLNG